MPANRQTVAACRVARGIVAGIVLELPPALSSIVAFSRAVDARASSCCPSLSAVCRGHRVGSRVEVYFASAAGDLGHALRFCRRDLWLLLRADAEARPRSRDWRRPIVLGGFTCRSHAAQPARLDLTRRGMGRRFPIPAAGLWSVLSRAR